MERRKVSCEVSKKCSDIIKTWATERNIRCFRSECYNNIYVEMELNETEIKEVNKIIDEYYAKTEVA